MTTKEQWLDLNLRQIREATRKCFEIRLLEKELNLDIMIERAKKTRDLWGSLIEMLEKWRKFG